MQTQIVGSFSTNLFRVLIFEPGYFYTLEVRLEDRGPYIQDVGRYSYHLVKVLDKKEAPDDFDHMKGDKPE